MVFWNHTEGKRRRRRQEARLALPAVRLLVGAKVTGRAVCSEQWHGSDPWADFSADTSSSQNLKVWALRQCLHLSMKCRCPLSSVSASGRKVAVHRGLCSKPSSTSKSINFSPIHLLAELDLVGMIRQDVQTCALNKSWKETFPFD